MVTVNELIDAIKESPLWETLSPEEKIEAIDYAFKVMELKTENTEEVVSVCAD
jgi:hypothetical protein